MFYSNGRRDPVLAKRTIFFLQTFFGTAAATAYAEFLKQKVALDSSGTCVVLLTGNVLAAIKFAKYYELTEDDHVVTILTDSMELYG